jgi:hypothetical protein
MIFLLERKEQRDEEKRSEGIEERKKGAQN